MTSPVDPTREAALERLAAFGARLERISLDDFRQMALSPSAARDRAAARTAAEQVAAASGMAELVDDVRARVRAHMDRVYTGGVYHPTWVTLNWGLSTGPVQDRVAATAAVEDAALATVVDGQAPDEIVATLREPFELIAEAHPPRPGGDALPSVDEVRRLGPFGAAVAVLLIVIVVAWFLINAGPL